jgi:hypothetical protein
VTCFKSRNLVGYHDVAFVVPQVALRVQRQLLRLLDHVWSLQQRWGHDPGNK